MLTGLTGAPVHSGSWFRLPDIGLTEFIQKIISPSKQMTSQGGSNLIGNPSPAQNTQQKAIQIPSPTQQTSGGGGGGGGGGTPQIQAPSNSGGGGGGGGSGGSSGPSLTDIINQAYDSEQGYLNPAESNARGQADVATKQLQTEYPQAQQSIQNQQNLNNQDLVNRTTQSQQNYSQGFAQTKQLLQDLQNRQAAQLAAAGGANSSSALALNEQFGKQAFGSVGNLRTSLQNSLDSIGAEKGKVTQFFTDKLTNLQNEYQRNINDINSGLQNALLQVSQSRAQSAQAKGQATMEAWNNYLNQRSALNLQAYNFATQLAAWKASKDGDLNGALQYVLGQTPTTDVNAGLFDPSSVAGSIAGKLQQGIVAPNAPIPVSNLQVSLSNQNDEQKRQLEMLGILPSSVSQGLQSLTA